ncbi:MAG: phage major capsid protein [Lachnospiraceae bacterium]|nr:phage major capsid protein [Lachnospiraceae bacterium]
MNRKKVLEARQQRLEARKAALADRSEKSQDANELRSIHEQLQVINEDLQDVAAELKALTEGDEGDKVGDDNGAGEETDERTQQKSGEVRGMTLQSFNKAAGTKAEEKKEERNDFTETLEYRQAFADYVRTGKTDGFAEIEQRAAKDGMVVTDDVGKIIPNTIMKEFIKSVGSYGQLYERVRKLNVKGGVEFPIEELVPEVRWITETKPSSNQQAPEIKNTISFGYFIAEARISQSLLSSIVSLDYLEREIAQLLSEAFAKEFDRMIVSGSSSGQPTGILNDTRVKATNKITFDSEDMADWKSWRKKLFAKIPLKYRGQGILIMTAGTWESNIMTLKDDNNNPIYKETYDISSGEAKCRFNGREVVLVEPDILKDYEGAEVGEAFAIYIKPTDYAINSNLQIGFQRYFDNDKNMWINKGLCIVDGKLLDVNSVFILKKGAAAEG